MERDEWLELYKRLIRAHSPRVTFSADQALEMFLELRDLSAKAAAVGVSHCIREIKYFPSVSELREAATSAVRSMPAPARAYCLICGGTGFRSLPPTAERLEAARVEMAQTIARSSEQRSARYPEPVTREAALEELREREAAGLWRPVVADVVERCQCRGGRALPALVRPEGISDVR